MAVKQLDVPELLVHWAPVTSKPSWLKSACTDYIVEPEPSSCVNGHAALDVNKHHSDSDMVRCLFITHFKFSDG